MSIQTLEQRLTAIEADLNEVKRQLSSNRDENSERPWWDQLLGAFKDDPDFDSAVARGAEIRRSQPTSDEEVDASLHS